MGWLKPLVIVALYTGLRLRELLTLTWGRANFERNQLTVDAGYAKNGTSRTIPLAGVVRETLLELRRERETNLREAEAVFLNEGGKPYRKPHNAFVVACKAAHVEEFRFHELRHTFASRLVMGGLNPRTVQTLIGQQSIKMTERYAHLSPSHLQEAVVVLDKRADIDSRQFPRHVDNTGGAVRAN